MALQDRAIATREAIIAGAALVFEDLGYGSASLAQVAERSNVTKGALYFHFKSKEHLALAIIEEQHRLTLRSGEHILSSGAPELEMMIMMCGDFGRQLLNEPIVRAGIRLTLEGPAFGHPVRKPYEDWISTMELLISRARESGDIKPDTFPDELARFVVATFTGVQMVSQILTGREDIMERIHQMWRIILPGIMSNPERISLYQCSQLVQGDLMV